MSGWIQAAMQQNTSIPRRPQKFEEFSKMMVILVLIFSVLFRLPMAKLCYAGKFCQIFLAFKKYSNFIDILVIMEKSAVKKKKAIVNQRNVVIYGK